jgi:hypothetical protein
MQWDSFIKVGCHAATSFVHIIRAPCNKTTSPFIITASFYIS